MGQNLGIYTAKEVNIIINDRTIIGQDEAEFVRVERTNEEEFTTRVGALGDFTFQENLDKSGFIVVIIKQNSPDNVFFRSLLEGKAVFPATVVAKHSYKELASATTCMMGRMPRKTFAAEESSREYFIACGQLIETDKEL